MIVAATGGGGMLGHALAGRLPGLLRWEEAVCDVTDAAAVARCLDANRPDVLVHAAAWTDVDGCEADPDRAHAVNAGGSLNVALACRERGIRLVAIGTDYVFAGDGDRPLTETDPTGPRSVYGESKLMGERAVLDTCPDATVLRTCGLYGPGGRHFPGVIARKIRAGEPLDVVDDQTVSPTYTRDLADAIARLLDVPAATGLFHVVNGGALTWFAFARAIASAMGRPDHPVRGTTSAALDRPAPRPAYSALDASKFEAACDMRLPTIADALGRFIAADLSEAA